MRSLTPQTRATPEQPPRRALLCLIGLLLSTSACPGPNPQLDGVLADYQRAPDAVQCAGNNDGLIQLSELTFVPGVSATYRVNPPGTLAPVTIAGTPADGQTQWDFSSLDGELVTVPLEPPAGTWYADFFPEATFAVGSDATGDPLQIVHLEPDGLQLLGLASRAEQQTLMVYDEPITLLRFPLRQGDQFTSRATVKNGKLNNLPIATEDTYQVHVDKSGTLRLATLKLENSLRVRIDVTTKAIGGAELTRRQVQWFHECYGEVVRAASQNNEPEADFTQASELRRLSF